MEGVMTMRKRGFIGKLTRCAALALVFGAVGGTAFSGATYFLGNMTKSETTAEKQEDGKGISSDRIQPTSTLAGAKSTEISGIIEEVMPSVGAITGMTQQEIMSFFGRGETIESESSGSGILIDKDDNALYIATNNHVVERTNALTVQFSDGTTAPAEVRGTAPSNDLAVVKVDLANLSEETKNTIKIAAMGDSDELSVGDAAIAIGNALGYGQSVTTGVISALGREVTFQDETGQTVMSRLIQTDAAINPGNSGGALINTKGEVIGINSSKYSDTDVEGMGFAIPSAAAGPILEDLIANGKTTTTGTPYIGIYGVDVTQEVSGQYNMPDGVYVAQVIEGSGAAKAGIVPGNIITEVNGEKVASMEDLKNCLVKAKVGDTVIVKVQIIDSGAYKEKEIPVTLTAQSEE